MLLAISERIATRTQACADNDHLAPTGSLPRSQHLHHREDPIRSLSHGKHFTHANDGASRKGALERDEPKAGARFRMRASKENDDGKNPLQHGRPPVLCFPLQDFMSRAYRWREHDNRVPEDLLQHRETASTLQP